MNDPTANETNDEGVRELGGLLRGLRRQQLLSQEELAEKAGLSVRTIRQFEKGQVLHPRRRSLELLAVALGLSDRQQRLVRTLAVGDARVALPPCEFRPAHQLPADLVDFVERAGIDEYVLRSLTEGSLAVDGSRDATTGGSAATPSAGTVRMVAVTGMAGVGKTALAVHAAHRLRCHFPDGHLFVDLQGTKPRPPTAGNVLEQLLRTLGIEGGDVPADAAERSGMLRDLLADRRALLVLDDAAGEEQVAPLLPGYPGCAVLVTSRAHLDGLAMTTVEVPLFSQGQSIELLGRIVGRPRLDAEPQAARQVVLACGGLPTAVRVAGAKAARRPHRPIARTAAVLDDDRRILDELRYGGLNVRTGLAESYRSLDGATGWAFRRLGGFGQAVFGVSDAASAIGDSYDTAELLVERLVDARLVEPVACPSGEPPRYRLYPLSAAYARWLALAETDQAGLPDEHGRPDHPRRRRRPTDIATEAR